MYALMLKIKKNCEYLKIHFSRLPFNEVEMIAIMVLLLTNNSETKIIAKVSERLSEICTKEESVHFKSSRSTVGLVYES